ARARGGGVTGVVCRAAAVTAMSDIADDRAGIASGLMTTAHEIGAALGVAVFSAVAVAVGGGIAAGYRHGFMVAAAVAAGLAVVAALAVPSVRPAPGAPVAVHKPGNGPADHPEPARSRRPGHPNAS